jgi:hypothetical protein
VGALNSAMSASPTNWVTEPPWASSTGTARPKCSFGIATTRSGGVCQRRGGDVAGHAGPEQAVELPVQAPST